MPSRSGDHFTPSNKTRNVNPLTPTLNRTTSQLSAISVSVDSPSRSVQQPMSGSSEYGKPNTSPMRHTTFVTSLSKASSLDKSSQRKAPSPGGSTTPDGSSSSSRKGKERMLDDVEVDDAVVIGKLVASPGSAAKGLRELVSRSTVGQEVRIERKAKGNEGTLDTEGIKGATELDTSPDRSYTPRRYYVLTNAGKPVFCSHDNSSEDNTINLMGVAQAIISIFVDDDDRLRCVVKGRHRIAFLLKAPLYFFCVSDWGEPEHVLRVHLEYLHLQILSVVSSTQLSRVFQRRSNSDLSRLLEGTESFLCNLITRCQHNFSYLTSTLQPLRMAPALRDTAAAALMPPAKFKDLLYVLLIAGGHIVTLLRPRKHSIHPSDLHLLLNTLASSTTLQTSESWLPICFPKFNPAGFVHAYVSYVLEDVGLVFVSADREAFEELQSWKHIVLEKLEKDRTLHKIEASIPLHPYSISAVACPGLRHFIYKSRQNVQLTAPELEGPYEDAINRQRLTVLYQRLHDTVHARSGQSSPLKLAYIRTQHEACLAWVTRPFELYLSVSPQMAKSTVVAVANGVARWIAAEEGKVFLKDAPVF